MNRIVISITGDTGLSKEKWMESLSKIGDVFLKDMRIEVTDKTGTIHNLNREVENEEIYKK